MSELIEPRVLKGFRDFLPKAEIERKALVEKVEGVFRSFGYTPIDTPALEYAQILLGKGGGETEKQIYRFTDHGGRDVALRFDLTVPFARFMAEHRAELALPFKRYHIAKVWRGENTQRGRYREFTQCDFDSIGVDSAAADFEILLIMKRALDGAGAGRVTIRVNHRGLFNRFLARLGVERAADVLRAVDKLAKIERAGVQKLLEEALDAGAAAEVLDYVSLGKDGGSWESTLAAMTKAAGGEGADSERLAMIRRFMADAGVEGSFVLDPSITRGLDYYTGLVYETFLDELPGIGSVCSGGRYDDLAGLYSKEKLSGAGASIGLDRLIAAQEALGKSAGRASYAEIAVVCLDEAKSGAYQALAERLRAAGFPCEVFCEASKPLAQFVLAEKRGLRYALISDDSKKDTLTLRDLASRTNYADLSLEKMLDILRKG